MAKTGKPKLDPRLAANTRDGLEKLYVAYGSTETALAARLDLSQPSVSALRAGRSTVSLPTALRASSLLGITIMDFLEGRLERARPAEVDAVPARAAAVAFARANGRRESAIEAVRGMSPRAWTADEWYEEIRSLERRGPQLTAFAVPLLPAATPTTETEAEDRRPSATPPLGLPTVRRGSGPT